MASAQKSRTDSKTGLHTSEYLVEELEGALASAKRRGSGLSVVMIDLDQLRVINDRHGQLVGDRLIRAAAEVVSDVATAHQGIAARFGGDEICLLLPSESLEPARQIAEEVRARIDQIKLPLDGSGELLGITASVGVASYPDHAPTGEGLLAAADVAAYDAKLEGRNRTSMASPPGVREALKLELGDPALNGDSLAGDDPEPVDEAATPASRPRLVAACLGALCAGVVLVGALSSAAIPDFLLLVAPLVGVLPLLTLWIAERQYVDRSRATVTELRLSNDELEAANERLFGLLDENRQLLGRMQRSYLGTITSLARAVEAKDPYTSGHTERVAEVALLLAQRARLRRLAPRGRSRSGAIIHDIGKIGVPDQILLKPGALTADEFREMREHPEMSSYIVAELELPAVGQADGSQPPRALRRRRATRTACVGERDSARRAHPLGGRRPRRDDERPALSRGDAPGGRFRRRSGRTLVRSFARA